MLNSKPLATKPVNYSFLKKYCFNANALKVSFRVDLQCPRWRLQQFRPVSHWVYWTFIFHATHISDAANINSAKQTENVSKFFFLLCVTFTGLMSNQKESRASVYGKLHSKPTVPQLTTQRKRFSMRCVVFRNIIEAGNSLIGILRKIHRAIKVNVSKHHFPVTISWNIASCSMTFRWCNRLIK